MSQLTIENVRAMKDGEKTAKYSDVHDWDDACTMASVLYGCDERCDGTPAESFAAGWVNAADMIDAGELDRDDASEVLRFVFSEFDNMGYDREQVAAK
jgi:hypothetical protein